MKLQPVVESEFETLPLTQFFETMQTFVKSTIVTNDYTKLRCYFILSHISSYTVRGQGVWFFFSLDIKKRMKSCSEDQCSETNFLFVSQQTTALLKGIKQHNDVRNRTEMILVSYPQCSSMYFITYEQQIATYLICLYIEFKLYLGNECYVHVIAQ